MPTIDTSQDYLIFDNTQTVTFTYLDGTTQEVNYCLQEGVTTATVDLQSSAVGQRSFCVWHVWKAAIQNAIEAENAAGETYFLMHGSGTTDILVWSVADVPIQIGCKLTDKNGMDWYVGQVTMDVWGSKYLLQCEGESGVPMQEVTLP